MMRALQASDVQQLTIGTPGCSALIQPQDKWHHVLLRCAGISGPSCFYTAWTLFLARSQTKLVRAGQPAIGRPWWLIVTVTSEPVSLIVPIMAVANSIGLFVMRTHPSSCSGRVAMTTCAD